ncbi:MAG TPA: hypothetical protein VKX40_03470 [Aequorivita sp.]|nr:hypothetical protein [Aequorivita sp.]
MKLKSFLILILLISAVGNAQDLNKIRLQYPNAVNNSELVSQMDKMFGNATSESEGTLLAYKGAIYTLKAKFAKQRNEKKELFKEGVGFIEASLKSDPNNIEIRYIRLSVQQNSPKFLGYHKNVEEDKEFVLNNYEKISSKDLRNVILDFIMKSGEISDVEKIESGKG